MINIVSSIYPYRLNIKEKEPIELIVKITNKGNETKLLSYDIALDPALSLDKSGLKKAAGQRMGEIKPDETKIFKFPIYAFQGIKPGNHDIMFAVNEHYLDYSQLSERTEKIIQVKSF